MQYIREKKSRRNIFVTSALVSVPPLQVSSKEQARGRQSFKDPLSPDLRPHILGGGQGVASSKNLKVIARLAAQLSQSVKTALLDTGE